MNVALSILEKRAMGRIKKDKRKTHSDNPYKHVVPVRQRNGKLKNEEQKRPVPKDLPERDKKILKKVRRRAYRWDMGWGCCCGIRWGWSSLIGIIPGAGDVLDVGMALWLIWTASRVKGGLPWMLLGRMLFNVLLDFLLGLAPFVGDIADMFYRANTRNAWLLDAYLEEKAAAIRAQKIIDPNDPESRALALPSELQVAPGDRDVEHGVEAEKVVAGPTPVAPAFTPGGARMPAAPQGGKDIPPSLRPGVPQRSLTGQQPQGRPRNDPRDYPRR